MDSQHSLITEMYVMNTTICCKNVNIRVSFRILLGSGKLLYLKGFISEFSVIQLLMSF